MSNVGKTANKLKEKTGQTINAMKNAMDQVMSGNCYLIVVYLVCIIFLIIFSYSIYLRREMSKGERTIKEMKNIQDSDKNPLLQALTLDDYRKEGDKPQTLFSMIDYYVKSSFNSCCTGPIINGHVSLDALKFVINQGIRFLDFEIYLIKDRAVVAVGRENVYIKDSLNELNLAEVFDTIKVNALESASIENNTDPLILHFRIMSNNNNIYTILAHTIKKYFSDYLVSSQYGFCGEVIESAGQSGRGRKYTGNSKSKFKNNILFADLVKLRQKVVIFASGPKHNPRSYKENREFYEIMNGGFNDGHVLHKTDYTINEASEKTTQEEHKNHYCISLPDITSKENSNAPLHWKRGTQAIMMNFGAGFNKSNMEYYKKMFAKEKRAFILKPKHLRRNRIFAGKPIPQDPRLNPIQKHCKLDDGAGGFVEISGVPGGAPTCE